MSFLILNYFSKSSLLIPTFTWLVDYQKQKNYCKGPLFTYGCINQGVKHWLFFGNYRIKVVKEKIAKPNRQVAKHFKKDTKEIPNASILQI